MRTPVSTAGGESRAENGMVLEQLLSLRLRMTAAVNKAKVVEGWPWLTCVPGVELRCNIDAEAARCRKQKCKEIHCYAWQPLAHAPMSEIPLLLTLHGKSHTLAAIVYGVMGITACHVTLIIVEIHQMLLLQAKIRVHGMDVLARWSVGGRAGGSSPAARPVPAAAYNLSGL